MTRTQHQQYRQQVLELVYSLVNARKKTISYQRAVDYLNDREIRTAKGNLWTRKRLFRFLQNAGFSGLWGLKFNPHNVQLLVLGGKSLP